MVALSPDVAAYPTAKTEPSDETATVTGDCAVIAASADLNIFSHAPGYPAESLVELSNLAKAKQNLRTILSK